MEKILPIVTGGDDYVVLLDALASSRGNCKIAPYEALALGDGIQVTVVQLYEPLIGSKLVGNLMHIYIC